MDSGLSVIIRNRNEADYIGFAIQSVLDHFSDVNKEIIVVDNESTDDSLYVASLFNDRVDIEYVSISNKEYTPGRALNLGFQNANYDSTLVLSAHCQITKLPKHIIGWIGNSDDKFKVVFGRQIPIYRGKKISQRYVWANFREDSVDSVNMISKSENRYFLHNAFCFYHTDSVLNQPFDEELSGKEDRYWAADFIEAGGEILYSSDLECNHFYTKNGATWKGIGALVPLFIAISQFVPYLLI